MSNFMSQTPMQSQAQGNGRTQVQGEDARVEVEILGQRMVLKGAQEAQHIERLAAYVKRKVDEVAAQGPISTSKLAVLAALNVADDYFRALEENRQFKKEVAKRSRTMLAELDR